VTCNISSPIIFVAANKNCFVRGGEVVLGGFGDSEIRSKTEQREQKIKKKKGMILRGKLLSYLKGGFSRYGSVRGKTGVWRLGECEEEGVRVHSRGVRGGVS